MRTTPIKETLEKHTPKPAEKEEITEIEVQETVVEKEVEKEVEATTEIQESKIVPFSKECWDECVKNSCGLSKIAEILLLKVTPSPTDDCKIEFEVANEIEKNEIKQVQQPLLQNLYEATGNQYVLEIQITKVIREKTVDKSNPDEKFIHLCKENPFLLEFKQRLGLGVS